MQQPCSLRISGGIYRVPRMELGASTDGMEFIGAMEAHTGLVRGQCQAMVTALTREFALLQGPLGIGKSYLSLKLLQVLLDCKAKRIWGQSSSCKPVIR